MTKDELRELAKQTFGLVEPQASEVVEEKFATATLEDGTKITNDKGSEFAVGDKVFVEVDGEKKDAPEGDHITKSGMSITLDADSIITGMKRPDEAGEGSEGLAEEEEDMKSVTEEMSVSEEVESEDKAEATTDEKFEEKVIEEEINMASLEDIIEVIGEVVEEKMKKMDERMKDIEEKMSAFASAPAEESVVASNFSKAKTNNEDKPLNERRYFNMLEKLNTITKK